MLLIQDVHIVIGREELAASTTRTGASSRRVSPRIPARGSPRSSGRRTVRGEGYEAVTLTAVADVDALERHQERLATGDLAECWSTLEAKQRHIDSSLHVLNDWSHSRRVASRRSRPARSRRRSSASTPSPSPVPLDTTLASLRDQSLRSDRRDGRAGRVLVAVPRRARPSGRVGAQPGRRPTTHSGPRSASRRRSGRASRRSRARDA